MTQIPFEGGGEWPRLMRSMTPAVLHGFTSLIYREAGIHLSDAKQGLIVGRLGKRLRALELATFRDYLDRVKHDPDERVEMLNCIATNETHFFRESKHFDLLRDRILPELVAAADAGTRARSIRVWSAGCSTGEEPFSLAMLLLDALPAWSIDILGTDISTRVLDAARVALWPLRKSSEIPPHFLHRYMLRGTGAQQGKMKATDYLRSVVRFERLNLNDARYAVDGKFDLIFCRNVLIYFDNASRHGVVSRLVDHLSDPGFLFVGHAESLAGVTDAVRCVTPTVYSLPDPDSTHNFRRLHRAQ